MKPCYATARARLTNSSSSAFPTLSAAVEILNDSSFVDPNTAAGRVIKKLSTVPGGAVPDSLEITPFGTGAANDTFSIRVIGYRRISKPLADGRVAYAKSVLAVLACTLGAATGLAGSEVDASQLFVDTIAITNEGTYTADATRAGSIRLFSPANDTVARAIVPLDAVDAFELEFDQTLNSPTMNALITPYEGTP